MITDGETKEYNIFFVEAIRALKSVPAEGVALALQSKLLGGRGNTRHWPNDEEVMDNALRRTLGSSLRPPSLRVLLERLEIHYRSKKSEDLNVQAALQVEHVMPVSRGAHWTLNGRLIPPNVAQTHWLAKDELAEMSEPIRQRNGALQMIGNRTLLNKYLTPAASNGSFPRKLVEYKHSVLRLNRYFDSVEKWDESSIQARGKLLGEAFCEI